MTMWRRRRIACARMLVCMGVCEHVHAHLSLVVACMHVHECTYACACVCEVGEGVGWFRLNPS